MESEFRSIRKQVSQQWQHINMCRESLERLAEMFQAYCQMHDVEHQAEREELNKELTMLQRVLEHQEELIHHEVNLMQVQLATLQRRRQPKVND